MIENTPNFFIYKNNTLPSLKYELNEFVLRKYGIDNDMLENCAITFSMFDLNKKTYKIANKEGNLILENNVFKLEYKFSMPETNTIGNYVGEFKIDFLGDNCGKITFPVNKKIKISVLKTTTKTNVIPISITTGSDSFDYVLDFDF